MLCFSIRRSRVQIPAGPGHDESLSKFLFITRHYIHVHVHAVKIHVHVCTSINKITNLLVSRWVKQLTFVQEATTLFWTVQSKMNSTPCKLPLSLKYWFYCLALQLSKHDNLKIHVHVNVYIVL